MSDGMGFVTDESVEKKNESGVSAGRVVLALVCLVFLAALVVGFTMFVGLVVHLIVLALRAGWGFV